MRQPDPHGRQTILGVAALAAATLLLESTLIRLLAVAQFYHFAFLAVGLALLGFGASGSLLSLRPGWQTVPPARMMTGVGLAFAATAGLAYAVVNLLPFDSYSIAWERRQILYFLFYYLALALPFLCSGLGIGVALATGAGRSHLVYAANLLGSGIGALLAPLTLHLAGVPGAVLAGGLMGLLPTLAGPARRWTGGLLLAGLLGFTALAALNWQGRSPLAMTISPYKGLVQALHYPGAHTLFSRWNAISRVDVVAGAGTRQLPGLSYAYPGTPPPQHGLALDAGSLQPITLVAPEEFAASAYMPEAIAFALRPQADALVLEPGGGLGVLQALAGTAARVTAVVDNRLVAQAVSRTAAEANVYADPRVQTIPENTRVFMKRDRESYGIVYMPLTDAYRPVTSGAYSLAETYGLTVEAFTAALDRLQPDGLLVVSRWLQTPPSESVRLIATLAEALDRQGGAAPAQALVAYRGIQVVTVLVQPGGWTPAELARIREFAEQMRYDLVWAPDIRPEEANRYNRLPTPAYFQAIQTLLTTPDRAAFYRDYPFAVAPPTDDHPFFFHFFTWQQTPEVMAALGKTWQPFGGSGYFVLLAMLGLAVVLSALLIVAPALLSGRVWPALSPQAPIPRARTLAYFALLGLAFLFVEIPLIQRWILLLGHPTYAFTAVVLALLSFSSLGSSLARAHWLPRRTALGLLVVLAVLTPLALARMETALMELPLPARGGLAALFLAPLAVLMGLPFPLGLVWLEEHAPNLVPWAWAINGCTSVIASVLAAILALSYGFTTVLLAGAAAYAVAWVVLFTGRSQER